MKSIAKKYWIWKIRDPMWRKTDQYYDENGINTYGRSYGSCWKVISKEKVEDDFITCESNIKVFHNQGDEE